MAVDCDESADPHFWDAFVGRDAGKIAEKVIAHLSSLVGGEVTVRLDIEATSSSAPPTTS